MEYMEFFNDLSLNWVPTARFQRSRSHRRSKDGADLLQRNRQNVPTHLILFLGRLNASKRHGTQPSHLFFLKEDSVVHCFIVTSLNSEVTEAWMKTPVMTSTTARPGIGSVAAVAADLGWNFILSVSWLHATLLSILHVNSFCVFSGHFLVCLWIMQTSFTHMESGSIHLVSQCHHLCKPYKTTWKLSAILFCPKMMGFCLLKAMLKKASTFRQIYTCQHHRTFGPWDFRANFQIPGAYEELVHHSKDKVDLERVSKEGVPMGFRIESRFLP